MEFTDKDKAARAAALEEFPARQKQARPKRYQGRRRRRPETFGQVLDFFQEDIRKSYRQGWKVDLVTLPVPPQAYRMLHIKRNTTASVIKAKLARRGLTVISVHRYGLELWFLVHT